MRNGMPIIGITPLWDDAQKNVWMLPAYLERVQAAGGVPVILPLTGDAGTLERIVKLCDGLLFAGGQDVAPALYGRTPDETVAGCPARDAMEVPLLRLALERDLPVLGICRGMQLLNVVLGGTLVMDLPSQRPSAVCHRQPKPYDAPAHTVALQGGLRELLGVETIAVNSCHHQGIERIAPGLSPMAVADDGLIEAVEKPGARFVWAVQWHPEMLSENNAPSRAIFDRFVHAAANCRI